MLLPLWILGLPHPCKHKQNAWIVESEIKFVLMLGNRRYNGSQYIYFTVMVIYFYGHSLDHFKLFTILF